jgi:uncharacterized surface protein with fasciclin (FAS1) repeats
MTINQLAIFLLMMINYKQTFHLNLCYNRKQYKLKLKSLLLAVFAIIASTITVNAQKTVVDIAIGSKDHTTLVVAVKAADLVATLQSAGPFTVFAPTNAAFAKLPAGTVETLLKSENKATLEKILTYHVIAGSFNAAAVVKAIKDGGGSVTLKTVSGGNLVASIKAGKVIITDEKGATATVVATDLKADNGLVHVIDAVVLPK